MLHPKIFIAGHLGMVGSAIFRNLKKKDIKILLLKEKRARFT